MPKYIDVERFCREICRCAGLENGCDKSKCPIWNAPTEDVVPVREGKWIYDHTYTGKQKEIYYCSRCNHYQSRSKSEQRKKMNYMMYCPFCGEKMDGEVIKSMKRAGDSAEKAAESLKNVIDAFENADRCVCCGEIVPEGRQVCPGCETGGDCDE